jgi:hypothetical protein
MPATLVIAVFVVGAILILASLLPSDFELFGNRIPAIKNPGQRLTAGLFGVALVATALYLQLQVPRTTPDTENHSAPAMTLVCHFTFGAKSGQTLDFSAVPTATPSPVGGGCTDGFGSTGIAVRANTPAVRVLVSSICQFMSGLKSGGWHDYAPMPALPIGTPCNDGVGSVGTVVTRGSGPAM